MDQGTWVGIVTTIVMLAFFAASIWALLPAQKKRFAEAAQLPLEEHASEIQGSDTEESDTEESAKEAAAKEAAAKEKGA